MIYYENLLYNEYLLHNIQANVSIIGIINAYFSSHSKENSPINNDVLLQVRINNEFFYDCCPFHYNTPGLFSFSICEDKKLCYCFGCGFGGSVFEFVMKTYDIDINEATELLGAFIGLFNIKNLNDKLKNIYDELIVNYQNKDILIEQSKRKTLYLTNRVDRYLENIDLDNINLEKISNRLCCSRKFVEKRYEQTDHYKQKSLILERKLEKSRYEFN